MRIYGEFFLSSKIDSGELTVMKDLMQIFNIQNFRKIPQFPLEKGRKSMKVSPGSSAMEFSPEECCKSS